MEDHSKAYMPHCQSNLVFEKGHWGIEEFCSVLNNIGVLISTLPMPRVIVDVEQPWMDFPWLNCILFARCNKLSNGFLLLYKSLEASFSSSYKLLL